ncbi:GNAT family N-acetyltransferase [Marinilongibacter aquaticus]|uniref:GNAT family N-acetyltransferase n=1 Tax=Marinilongibacter aquaticus TaxID=2975157 RepID=UPI0021BDCA56|nr:GNAT family N-acetyltransferase [Marinilongibacter aquaticus]UBM60345.1 GNAT family N-acetyltransferase [Marinilongibacter aquaticus]
MELLSERLSFAQLALSDKSEALKISMNDLIMRHITGKALDEQAALERFQNQIDINAKDKNLGFFLARKRDDGVIVGSLKFVHFSPEEYEVGYLLKPEFWGKGYASEMLAFMIDYAAQITPRKNFFALASVANTASIRVLEKKGFQEVSRDEKEYRCRLSL